MATYNLITQPWIRVRSQDGALRPLGLRDALVRAHELAAVEHPIPIVEAGVWRLLVALVLDIFPADRLRHLVALLEQGRFPEEAVDEYFDRHAAAFDLFSPTRPFLQDADAGGPEKPVAALLPSQPSGTNVVHWHHGHENDFAIGPAEAAGLLAAIAPFMTAGGAGLSPSINGAPPWYVMIEGPTLFHSILLNVWAARPRSVECGVPAWRRETPLETRKRRQSATLAESLTWQPRSIRLLPGPGGRCALSGSDCDVLVRRMHFMKGESCDFEWTDPNVGYVTARSGRTPVRPREDRAPWRDLGPLALLQEAQKEDLRIQRPEIITQFGRLVTEYPSLGLPDLRLRLYGMRTDGKMKVFEWYRDELHLPAQVSHRKPVQEKLVDAIEEAEKAQGALGYALSTAVTVPIRSDSKSELFTPDSQKEALIRAARRQYWAALEDPFRRLALELGALHPEDDARDVERAQEGWRETIRRTALDAFDSAAAFLRGDARHLASMARGRAFLLSRLSNREARLSATGA
ncbi:MAG TPA: type I-E CRISPR-associated protein Cse1/CasA [Longimicrobiales bacterium]